jgi:hypothetical protein
MSDDRAEARRVHAEEGRRIAEEDRVLAEGQDVGQEGSRRTAESGRVTGEDGRVIAEDGRVVAEGVSGRAEEGRITGEGGRITAEDDRVTAGNARFLAEGGRVTAEGERVTAEDERASAEDRRVKADTLRAFLDRLPLFNAGMVLMLFLVVIALAFVTINRQSALEDAQVASCLRNNISMRVPLHVWVDKTIEARGREARIALDPRVRRSSAAYTGELRKIRARILVLDCARVVPNATPEKPFADPGE